MTAMHPGDGLDYAVMSYGLARDLCECFRIINIGDINKTNAENFRHLPFCPLQHWREAHQPRSAASPGAGG